MAARRRSNATRSAFPAAGIPRVHLTCHLSGKPVWNERARGLRPRQRCRSGCMWRAPPTGTMKLADCLVGRHRDRRAGGGRMRLIRSPRCRCRMPRTSPPPSRRCGTSRTARAQGVRRFPERRHREGYRARRPGRFRAVEHLKRYTTLGMATDQGKVSNVSGLAILAEISGRAIPEVGTTTYRPPYVPVEFRRDVGPSPRQGLPPDPAAALAPVGGRTGRGVRRVRRVAARAIFSARRRDATGSRP